MSLSWLLWKRPPCLRQAVIVNLKSDDATALRGVLWSASGDWLTLKQAALVTRAAAPTSMDGDVVIPLSNVSFIQVIPPD